MRDRARVSQGKRRWVVGRAHASAAVPFFRKLHELDEITPAHECAKSCIWSPEPFKRIIIALRLSWRYAAMNPYKTILLAVVLLATTMPLARAQGTYTQFDMPGQLAT